MTRRARRLAFVVAAVVAVLLPGALAGAHEIRPGLLEIEETSQGLFEVTWKVPMRGDLVLSMQPELPASLEPVGSPSVVQVPGASIQRLSCRGDAEALVGEEVFIGGLSRLQIDVMLRITLADGTSWSAMLRPHAPRYVIPARPTMTTRLLMYLRIGIEHILGGVDHLLFVLGLLFLVRERWMLVKTITSFTIAHSITLGVATLGYAEAPVNVLNVLIAMSILFLGPEIVRRFRGQASLTIDHPWIVAFAFGLLHGFGFAGGLLDLGLPQAEIPLALLMFNVGVEIGQLGFVFVLLAVGASLRALEFGRTAFSELAPAYVIGSLGAYWTIDRLVAALGL